LHQIVGGVAVFANSQRDAPQLAKMREGQSIKVFPVIPNHFVLPLVYGCESVVYSLQADLSR
jgi:hypothetical protein